MGAQNILTDDQKSLLEENGFSIKDAMQRFMNNEQLWIKFLKKFKADTSYADLVQAVEGGEWKKAFEAAHTLKGITGNLALSRFNELISEQTDYLREPVNDFGAAAEMMPRIAEIYDNTIKIIDEVCGE